MNTKKGKKKLPLNKTIKFSNFQRMNFLERKKKVKEKFVFIIVDF